MTAKTLSRKATLTLGALMAYLAPRIAQDAKIDLRPALDGVDAKNFGEKKTAIVNGVKTATKDKLAKDASIEDLGNLLDAVGSHKDDDAGSDAYDAEGGSAKALCEFLKTKLSPEDYAQVEKMLGGPAQDDSNPNLTDNAGGTPGKPQAMDKAAMDAAIQEATEKASKTATEAARKEQRAIREAEKAIRPYVGEIAMDSIETAADVYRAAFKHMGVDVKDVHESAFPALLKAQKPAARATDIAQDAADSKGYADRFPNAARLGA